MCHRCALTHFEGGLASCHYLGLSCYNKTLQWRFSSALSLVPSQF